MENDYYKIDRMSNSMMKHFARSPRHYLWAKNNPIEPTEAMIFGNAFHTFILENEKYNDRYIVIPFDAPKKPTKAQLKAVKPSPDSIKAMEWWDEFNKIHLGKTVLDFEDFETIQKMTDALHRNDFAMELMNSITQTEKELIWTDDVTGVPMKGKMDGCNDDFTIDLKTCINAQPEAFSYAAYDMAYDRQAALYLDGRGEMKMKKGDFYFIAIEKTAPFGISVMKASREFIAQGRFRYGQILENFVYWQNIGSPDLDYSWNNPMGYHSLGLPPWVK